MTRTEASRTIATAGRHHTIVVYFTKRTNGQERRMVLRYAGDPIQGGLVKVWDLEKGAWRTVNLDAVHELRICGVDRKAEPAGDRDPIPPSGAPQATLAELKAEMDELFY